MKSLLFLFLFSIAACKTNPSKEAVNIPSDSSANVKRDTFRVTEPLRDGETFRVRFPPHDTTVSFKGFISGQGDKQVYFLKVHQGQQLKGEITTDTSMANIRFNQIIAPSGAADGPFGNTIEYHFTESGDYQLIVAESLMADEWRGSYRVKLEIK